MTKPRWTKTQAQIDLMRRERIRRGRNRPKVIGKRSAYMASIRVAELTRWLDHTNGAGVELEPSSRSETIAHIMVNHLVELDDGKRRAAEWLTAYCPWFTLRSRESLIGDASHHPIKWTADKLAWKIGLRDNLRTELKITTIGAIDVTKEQRAARRKAMQAAAQRALRAKRKADRVTTI